MNKTFGKLTAIGIIAVLALALFACSGKSSGSGGSSGGGRVAAESDFTVAITADNDGARITDYNGSASNVVIPATIQGLPVREIGFQAFADNKTITSVVIPEGVTIIGGGVFWGCTSLSSLSLPAGVTEIGQRAFRESGLTSFPNPWPKAVTTINAEMFTGSKLRTVVIPEGITTIMPGAFSECLDLTSVTMPSTITEMDGSVFRGSRKIDLASQARIRQIEPHAMF